MDNTSSQDPNVIPIQVHLYSSKRESCEHSKDCRNINMDVLFCQTCQNFYCVECFTIIHDTLFIKDLHVVRYIQKKNQKERYLSRQLPFVYDGNLMK